MVWRNLELIKKDDIGIWPKYVYKIETISVPICPKCGLPFEDEKDSDIISLIKVFLKLFYSHRVKSQYFYHSKA